MSLTASKIDFYSIDAEMGKRIKILEPNKVWEANIK